MKSKRKRKDPLLKKKKNRINKRLNAYKFNITKTISAKNTGRGNTEELLVSTFDIKNERLEKIY